MYKDKQFNINEFERSKIMQRSYMVGELLEYFHHVGPKPLSLVICFYFYCTCRGQLRTCSDGGRGRAGNPIRIKDGTLQGEEVTVVGESGCCTLRKESSDPLSMNSVTIMTGRLLVTTPSRRMTLGCSNCPMMLASLRNSRRCSSV